jgi:hypothetical protein
MLAHFPAQAKHYDSSKLGQLKMPQICYIGPIAATGNHSERTSHRGAEKFPRPKGIPMRSYNLPMILLGLSLFLLPVDLAQAAEFSAVVVTTHNGQEIKEKMFVKGDKVRRDFSRAQGAVVILRGDKKAMWMLMPEQKMAMEMDFDQDALAKTLQLPEDEMGKTKVGAETINGYATDKYETWVKMNGGKSRSTMWIAPKLGAPIKIVSEDKTFTQEYRDIKEGGVNDSLFEIPAGYEKMTMPKGMPPMK